MASTLTLTTLRSRVRSMLGDLGAHDWSNDRLDTGIRLALEEYSRAGMMENAGVQGREIVTTTKPAAGVREIDLSSLSPAVLQVDHIWYPYDATIKSATPIWVSFDFWMDDGKPTVFLNSAVGDGIAVARLFYRTMHTLNGLDAASASTFSAKDDGLLTLGAAGHACAQRAIELGDETERDRPGAGYSAASRRWLTEFRKGLLPRKVIRVVSMTPHDGDTYYDPTLLEYRQR